MEPLRIKVGRIRDRNLFDPPIDLEFGRAKGVAGVYNLNRSPLGPSRVNLCVVPQGDPPANARRVVDVLRYM